MSGPDSAGPMRVRFAVVNLRMGGQVSGVLALMRRLAGRGIDADLLLPDAAGRGDKMALDRYGRRPLPARLLDAMLLLRRFATDPAEGHTALHLVLPSPAFAALAAVLGRACHRTLIQYEGASTRLDRLHLEALRRDPAFVGPRLVLNHRGWARVGRWLPTTHLATCRHLAIELRELGFRRVVEIANLAELDLDDLSASVGTPPETTAALAEICSPDRRTTWCGYIGHGHPVKGVTDLLEAMSRAAPRHPNLRLLMALSGDRPAAWLRARASELGLGDCVAFAGLVPVPRLLAWLDALVLPYRMALSTTMLPSLLLEADEARCPVIVGGVPELVGIVDESHPHVVVGPPGDVGCLAAAMGSVQRRIHGGRPRPLLRIAAASERVDAYIEVYRGLVG